MMENESLGGKYGDFTNFTSNELIKHTGLYLFQSFYPPPQVEMNFSSSQ